MVVRGTLTCSLSTTAPTACDADFVNEESYMLKRALQTPPDRSAIKQNKVRCATGMTVAARVTHRSSCQGEPTATRLSSLTAGVSHCLTTCCSGRFRGGELREAIKPSSRVVEEGSQNTYWRGIPLLSSGAVITGRGKTNMGLGAAQRDCRDATLPYRTRAALHRTVPYRHHPHLHPTHEPHATTTAHSMHPPSQTVA